MASTTSVSDRAAAWRRALAPWLESLHERLSITATPALPDRDAIARHLWIRFAVPDQTQSPVLRAAGDAERAWIQRFEALELLDLLARVDSAACWTLLLEICDADEALRRRGCPVAFFHGVQPRYELRFAQMFAPTDHVESLLLGGPRAPSSPAFTQVKVLLLAALRSETNQPLRLPPVRLRYWFALPRPGHNESPVAHYNGTVRFLKRVLALARALPATRRPPPRRSRFFVGAFGFCLPSVAVRDGQRTLLRQIADHVPVFGLTYQRAQSYNNGNFFGPFLWTLLPLPSRATSPQSLRGLRKLDISAHGVSGSEAVALCASIAESHSLREFSLLDDSPHTWRYDATWAVSLALALFHKTASHQIHTVQLKLQAAGIRSMTRVLSAENSATYLATWLDAGRPEDVYSRPMLTKVRVRAGAEVIHRQDASAFAVKTISNATSASGGDDGDGVECYVAGQDYGPLIRVFAPGVGLCCVRRSDVLCEFPAEPNASHPVRSLTLRVTVTPDMTELVGLLNVIGESLTEFILINVGAISTEATSLDALLAACPRLKRLELSRVMLSQQSLVPYGGGGLELESLTLRGCDIVVPPKRKGEKPRVLTATTFPRLDSLLVEVGDAQAHVSAFSEFLVELAVARDVQRFVVVSVDQVIKDTYQSLLEQRGCRDGDRLSALPLRHKLALLSAVTTSHAPRARCGLNVDVLTRIFEMVAPPIRHRNCSFLA